MSPPESATVKTATNLHPITPASDWAHDDASHPGFVIHGVDDTPGPKAYYIHLEAKPGKEDVVLAFMKDIRDGVNQEPGTGPWFALRYSKTTFAIFEAFPHAGARHDHDRGPGGRNFLRVDLLRDMLAYPAQIYRVDVEFGKFSTLLGREVRDAEGNFVKSAL